MSGEGPKSGSKTRAGRADLPKWGGVDPACKEKSAGEHFSKSTAAERVHDDDVGLMERSRTPPRAVLRPLDGPCGPPGAVLKPPGVLLEPSWDLLEDSWTRLEASWNALEAVLKPLGMPWEPS